MLTKSSRDSGNSIDSIRILKSDVSMKLSCFFNNPIIDSGASQHMFNNLAHVTNFLPNNDASVTVELAEGLVIPIVGKGNVGLLTNVLYTPDLKFIVISIAPFDALMYSTLFGHGLVSFDPLDQLFLRGVKTLTGLYVVDQQTLEKLLCIPPIICVIHQYSAEPYLNIHACLGHPCARRTSFVCQYED